MKHQLFATLSTMLLRSGPLLQRHGKLRGLTSLALLNNVPRNFAAASPDHKAGQHALTESATTASGVLVSVWPHLMSHILSHGLQHVLQHPHRPCQQACNPQHACMLKEPSHVAFTSPWHHPEMTSVSITQLDCVGQADTQSTICLSNSASLLSKCICGPSLTPNVCVQIWASVVGLCQAPLKNLAHCWLCNLSPVIEQV